MSTTSMPKAASSGVELGSRSIREKVFFEDSAHVIALPEPVRTAVVTGINGNTGCKGGESIMLTVGNKVGNAYIVSGG